MSMITQKIKQMRPGVFLFFVLVAAVALGNGLSDGVYSNYFKEVYQITAFQRGLIEFPRELPGLLCAVVIGALSFLGDLKTAFIAQILSIIGVTVLGLFTPTFAVMLIFLFINSMGMHMFMPLQDAIGMSLAEPNQVGKRMGQFFSTRAAFNLIAALLVFFGFRYGFFGHSDVSPWHSLAVVLPKAMAYATVAGLPVAVGLYTAFVPMLVYALLGSSRVLSVSSTATLAILAGTQLGLAVPDGDPARLVTATATLGVLVGVLLLAARVLGLGFVANFISTPVLTGFKAGIGLVIVLDQVPKLLGLHIEKQGFFSDLLSLLHHLPATSFITLAVALATFAVLLAMERKWPHSPAPLIAVGGSIAASWYFGLSALGVSTVGLIPQGFASITLPDPGLIEQMLPGALGIALMSFTESIAAGRAFVAPGDPPINANRELVATGLANVGGAFMGAMPAGGGTSQTAVVRAAATACALTFPIVLKAAKPPALAAAAAASKREA